MAITLEQARPARWTLTMRRRRGLLRLVYLYIPLLFFMTFALFPFLWLTISSFTPETELYDADRLPWEISSLTLEHYVALFQKTAFAQWVMNSLIVAGTATVIAVLLGTLAGYALARLRFAGASSLGMGIIVTYLVPTSVLFLPLAYVFYNWGLGDNRWALILAYPTHLVPFCTWFLLGYFKTIPVELEESAIIDGCTRVQALYHITLPLALPGALAASIFAFTFSWNEFIYALTFISTDSLKTVPVGVHSQLVLGDAYYWGRLMAATFLGSMPIAIIYAFLSEFFVKGLTAGALKH
jgi:multiple sugar transport system permease protein